MVITNTQYELTFPDEAWKESTVYTFDGPFDDGVKHNLVLVIDTDIESDIPIAKYADIQIEGPKRSLPGFELQKKNEKKMADGTPSFEVIYSYAPAEGIQMVQKQRYVIKNKKGYIFTSTYSPKTVGSIGPVIDRVIDGFKLFEKIQEDE